MSNPTTSKSPTHYAYHVKDLGQGKKSFFTKVGCAWANNDGKGFNIQLDVIPLDGRITLRLASEEK